jgi:hypothetical protein
MREYRCVYVVLMSSSRDMEPRSKKKLLIECRIRLTSRVSYNCARQLIRLAINRNHLVRLQVQERYRQAG